MTLLVRLLGRAQNDVDDIYAWLARKSPVGAMARYIAFVDKLHELERNAAIGSIAPEATRLRIELRQTFFKTRRGRRYRLLFVVAGDEARVLRVRGPGQRPVSRRDLPSDES